MVETKDAAQTIEIKLDRLVKGLEDLDSYLTGEKYEEGENCPQVVSRLFTKLNRCTSAAASISEIIHQLT